MTLAASAIFQGYDQNILQGATITSSPSPMSTYDLATLGFNRPDFRVRFDSGTVTIDFAVAASGSPATAQGDILVIPMSNIADGCLSLTNDEGFNESIPVPGTLRNGLPKTIVADLTLLETNASTRTTNGQWHLVVTGNPVNVTLGGAIAIYGPKTALGDRDFQWGYTTRKVGGFSESKNEYLTRFRLNMESMERSILLSTLATDADADALEAWYDANNGGLPGLLWLTPEIEDAFFGFWDGPFERVVGSELVPDTNIIRLPFTELSKGIPLL